MGITKNTNLSRRESIIGIMDRKKEHELQIVVSTTLQTLDTTLGNNNSIVTPGSYVIVKANDLDTSSYHEGDILRVDGYLIKQGYKRPNVYVANGEIGIRKLSNTDAKKMIVDEMLSLLQLNWMNQDLQGVGDGELSNLMRWNKSSTNLKTMRYKQFVSHFTPAKIESELNIRVVGQEELTKSAADFLYYHALRQFKPELPPRPMLISGPSGSGKTEVWRVAKKLFGNIFNIEIVDGASMTQEGFSGKNKLSSHIDKEIADGGILVVDEFDKLSKPNYESNGTNVASKIQAEFLKLLEGEYTKQDDKNKAGIARQGIPPIPCESKIETKKMGIVLVGAFEDIRSKRQNCVGFGNRDLEIQPESKHITDEEYIEFGVVPELIGRVATKVTTNQLSDDEYIEIIHNPYSRVSVIANIFKEFDIDMSDALNEGEMRDLIRRSKSNKTGVRWVSAQIEEKMLEMIRDAGIGDIVSAERERRAQASYPIDEWMKKQVDNGSPDSPNNKEDEFFF